MRIVIKVGTSTLTYKNGNLNIRVFSALCRAVADIKNAGNEVIIVSSGAIALGKSKLRLDKRPADVPTKQAAAAVGQCELMCYYDREFKQYCHGVAQILIGADDLTDNKRSVNFSNTVERLLELGALPVINENDTVAIAELSPSDNDTLSALVAVDVKADLLVLLSDIDGLYSADPHLDKNAKLIQVVEEITPALESVAGGSVSGVGTGGMATKISAAKFCMCAGCDMVIANGANPDILYKIVEGEPAGTLFKGKKL